jgi:sortase A
VTDRDTLLPPVPPVPPMTAPVVYAPESAGDDRSSWTSAAVDGAPGTRRQGRPGRGMGWDVVGVVLTGIGVLLLLFFTYLYVFTPLTHARDQHALLQSLVGHPKSVFSLVDHPLPAEGKPVGILTIPALHQREVVIMGTSAADLQQGPGLMANSAVPGDWGNAVIAGRRATYGAPFGSLDTLVRGDRVQIVDGAGDFTFRVASVREVSGTQTVSVPVRGQAWLTLVTSSSAVGATGHVIVVAKATAAAFQTATPPSSKYDTGQSGRRSGRRHPGFSVGPGLRHRPRRRAVRHPSPGPGLASVSVRHPGAPGLWSFRL